MMLLNTSLLRERFTIKDVNGKTKSIVALGNRISLPLKNGHDNERFVVRAHSMHMALRMASFVTREFFQHGSILNRQNRLDFAKQWQDMVADFEHLYNPDTWCCIYYNGRPYFNAGDYPPFLDVIEQCDIKNRAEYDQAVKLAETIFSQAGKDVTIDHNVNIAVVIGAMAHQIRCGLILRSPKRTTTFNFIMEQNKSKTMPLHPYDGLELSSYFLEGIQLAVTNGMTEYLIDNNQIKSDSVRAKTVKTAYNRIGKLAHSIRTYEQTHAIRYRPEKPDFMQLLHQAKHTGGE